jgi:hypothetical protein
LVSGRGFLFGKRSCLYTTILRHRLSPFRCVAQTSYDRLCLFFTCRSRLHPLSSLDGSLITPSPSPSPFKPMAISPDYPGLSAEVIVDGQPSKECEYNDTTVEREPHTVVRYVRVNSNARFSVRVTIPKDLKCKHGVWINLKVDGEEIEWYYRLRKRIEKRSDIYFDRLYSTIDGAPVTQKLRFCGIDIGQLAISSSNIRHSHVLR